ncbi:uncharacterized protein VP01_1010g6 [Puccinia sorghi]|uniref:Integrase catalytic domain-containing protein n=1 Tax=Puccinia sorghi TaxID=27349 RepID=A0A0L6VV99_9BASI|nr:uncharacterized protein VP01_1010g6 [Puccinia sorghi]
MSELGMWVRKFKLDACCKMCATTKATRNVVSLPLRGICNEPGDVIAAEIIGPYKESVEGHHYILTIQDLSSGMVSAIPLRMRGKSTKEIVHWIGKFITLSRWAVKHLQKDNALDQNLLGRNRLWQISPYAKKLQHIGIAPDFKVWLLWFKYTGKVITAASVRFDEAPTIHVAYLLSGLEDQEAVLLAIACEGLGDFLHGQCFGQAGCHRGGHGDPHGSHSLSYEEAVKSAETGEWKVVIEEEMALLEHHRVHVEDEPPKDKKHLL